MNKRSSYFGRRISLATMHGKERAISPEVFAILGAQIVRPSCLDTDILGTFTGEIERVGTMGDVAIAKARLGMQQTGIKLGLASEGTYGPHPYIPFMTGGCELMVFVDDERNLVIFESLIDDNPCFENLATDDFNEVRQFFKKIDFPDQAVIVSSSRQSTQRVFFKGLKSVKDVEKAFKEVRSIAENENVVVQTDMRAHLNSRRMNKIGELARKICKRIACCCPKCQSPGFGRPGPVKPLPCSWCGESTAMASGRFFECVSCDFSEFRSREDGLKTADPLHCSNCNP